ncbi:MAG: signal peptide peptidase SppA [Bacteroidetes bacterium]|jgi:protease IV|nr:signal peptide peptidase SppA [Bacteroidota bacterium]MBT3748093.1 signal peptide peptidase SppA [Bacteroidota bacterium]
MKSFFKYLLASFLAFFLALIILFLIGLGSMSALISNKTDETKVKPNTILTLDLSVPITDRTIDDPFSFVNYTTYSMTGSLGIYDIFQNLKKAAVDPNIKGLLIKTSMITPGIASLEEIRQAIVKFKKSGKFVIAYGDFLTQSGYYLASVADKIYINPEGIIEFRGLRSDVMFYTDALEKLGIEVQVLRHGKFKSAVEPFMDTKMSDASKRQTKAYLDAIWGRMIEDIGDSRNISTPELNNLADKFAIRTPQSALKHQFVDGLFYTDQLNDELKKLTGIASSSKIRSVSMNQYIHAPETEKKEYTSDRIAIIYGTGSIGMQETGATSIGGHHLAKAFRSARNDNRIKAIVFRINSPGGNVLASDIIRREVELAAAKKPLIVSMGDLAASGGYWVSTPAKTILASPTTLTGSIGVFGLWPNLEGLVSDKLGLHFDGVQTNDMAGMGNMFRPLEPQERAIIQGQVENSYQKFIHLVAKDRNMKVEEVDQIGQGRVWSGKDAIDIGLIDGFGGLEEAIRLAAEAANLEEYKIREMPQLKDPLNEILEQVLGRSVSARRMLEAELPVIRDIRECLEGGSTQARLPFTYIIK